VTSALLGKDPDVEHLRFRIGREIRDRLCCALGAQSDSEVLESLEQLYAGALVRAGMGYASYSEIATKLEKSARLCSRKFAALSFRRMAGLLLQEEKPMRRLVITQNITVDGRIEMLGRLVRSDPADEDLLAESGARTRNATHCCRAQHVRDFRAYWPALTDDPTGSRST